MKAQQLREIVKVLSAPCADRRKIVSLMKAIREFKARDAAAVEKAIAMAKAMQADASFIKLLEGLTIARTTKARIEVTFKRSTIPFHHTTGCVTVFDSKGKVLFESMFGIYFKAPTLFNSVKKINVVLPPNDLSESRHAKLIERIEAKFAQYWDSIKVAA